LPSRPASGIGWPAPSHAYCGRQPPKVN